jgi:2-methylisocitrate lyase-like PEP mutase family enzyme
MDPSAQNELAVRFRKLHVPGEPLILCNVYDGATAAIVASNPATKAIATASYAIAATYGVDDDDLSWEQNLAAIQTIASVVSKSKLPLTVDLQDGYDDIQETVRTAIKVGAVGCNIEDVDNKAGELRPIEDAVKRIKLAVEAARSVGVPDFAINARTDTLGHGGSIDDAIKRAKAYLAAGANTAFVWGGAKGRGISTEEIKELVRVLEGRLNVMLQMGPGFLSVSEVKALGVARISVGPSLYVAAMNAYRVAANSLLEN